MKHKHRITPGHMGGKYVEGNVLDVEVSECNRNTANHAMWHYANWRLWGKVEDKLAWRGLAGYLGKEEIILEVMKNNGRNSGLKNKGRKFTDEHKVRISESHKGKRLPQETRDKMSRSHLGQPSPQRGKPRTPKEKLKISSTLKGRERSETHCQNLSRANIGVHIGKSWWVNQKGDVKFCHECPGSEWMKGRKWKG